MPAGLHLSHSSVNDLRLKYSTRVPDLHARSGAVATSILEHNMMTSFNNGTEVLHILGYLIYGSDKHFGNQCARISNTLFRDA